MPCRVVLFVAVALAATAMSGQAEAQRWRRRQPQGQQWQVPQRPTFEYVVIQNSASDTLKVYLRAKGGKNPDKDWRGPVEVKATEATKKITLPCCEPFDIRVLRGDRTYIELDGLPLCALMTSCRAGGIKVAAYDATGGRWSENDMGQIVTQVDAQMSSRVVVTADYDTVEIPISPLAGKPDPRPIPEKPKPKPNK